MICVYIRGLDIQKSRVIVGDIVPQDRVQIDLFENLENDSEQIVFIRRQIGSIDQWEGKVQIVGQGLISKWGLKRKNCLLAIQLDGKIF